MEPRELSFAHLQTNWANGVKITGARRALLPVELVLSAGHRSTGDGKIAATKVAWLHREPRRNPVSWVRVQVRACVRAPPHECEMRACSVHAAALKVRETRSVEGSISPH